jgi:hypothetical protein
MKETTRQASNGYKLFGLLEVDDKWYKPGNLIEFEVLGEYYIQGWGMDTRYFSLSEQEAVDLAHHILKITGCK